ncbi:transglycosylase SLT domain-containing protein [Hyalangium rubrum]|uniref:Transglycosylase SLT domain-containing protein n=1 Tax=Hyalangium rubrum TaxID=3103134 RepID=A0ABU5HIB9_9BACT|nr:transglycosylase SLT domain-containing protein [Hyalangium sp. s54d21]MDY7233213.1 transglycosylase SLT domain-containing protein [Hyalangium sp. s54d21]
MDTRGWKRVGLLGLLLGAACAHREPVRPATVRTGVGRGPSAPSSEALVSLPPPPPRARFAQVREEQGRAWRQEWNLVIAEALDDIGRPLLEDDKVPAEEVQTLCPGYFGASREEKKAFWALLFASIARLESGFDPERTFMEPRPLRTLSVGLLQLSYGDQTRHEGCALEPMEANITDPAVNLRCGVAILRNQLARRNTLFPRRFYYWSVLTRKREQIERDFLQHQGQLGFCRMGER